MNPIGARFVTAKTTYIADGKTLTRVYENEYSAVEQMYGAPWFFTHRIDLHTELKRLATTEDGVGSPATLKAHCKVVSYVSIRIFDCFVPFLAFLHADFQFSG